MNTSLRADTSGARTDVPGAAAPAEASREIRQTEVVAALAEVLPRGAILFRHEDTVPYECDALTAYRTSPMVVVLPETETQVASILKLCHRMGVPIIARGAGTGLSGGATPHPRGVILSLAKFNKILKIDPKACTAVVPSAAMWPRIPAAYTA
jgi:glycolate oxidase